MTNRFRQRDDSRLYMPVSHYVNGGQTTYGYYGVEARSLPNNFSRMIDTVGNRDGFNAVYHTSWISTHGRYANFYHGNDFLEVYQYPHKFMLISDDMTNEEAGLTALTPTISIAQRSAASQEAFNKFHDQIPQEVSIANFLYELRDIKGMIPKIERSLSRTASSNFLAFEFGVKPFIGDIQKMLTITETLNKRLAFLRKTLGEERPLSHTYDIPHNGNSLYDYDMSPYSYGNNCRLKFRLLSHTGKARFSSRLIQNLEGLSDTLSVPKALAAALGLNNPAAIVWEAIPYSFVVDWFFHLQAQLNRLAIQPFGGEWSLSKVGWSTKQDWLYEMIQDTTADDVRNEIFIMGNMRITSYGREPGLPVPSLFATDGTLTPKQQLLSLALLNQRRK